MRTVIFLGLLAIAQAINNSWVGENAEVFKFFGIVLTAAIIMDVTDFLNNFFGNKK